MSTKTDRAARARHLRVAGGRGVAGETAAGSGASRSDRSPAVPVPVAAAMAGLFRALSAARGRRIFHPYGIGYHATFTVDAAPPAYRGVSLLERPGSHPALVRCSRAIGLPEPLPDLLGLTVRLRDLHGPGAHQDFPLITSADGPILHHLLLPAANGFFGQSFSSVLLYRIGPKVRLVGALPVSRPVSNRQGDVEQLVDTAAAGDARFRLALASVGGRWEPIGDLTLGERLPDEETERLRFNPWNTGGGIRPVGPLMGIRAAAYEGSQRGRGV